MSGRTSMLIFLAIMIIAVGFLILRPKVAGPQQSATLPLELKNLIPPGWQVIPDQERLCDYNGDQQQEWMILYQYDSTPDSSVIGGVIFSTDVVTPTGQANGQSAYLPTLLIPYKLLPDLGLGKGQGYLGETKVAVNLYPPPKQGESCKASEIVIFGYSGDDTPATRLSVFRWAGPQIGYQAAHFIGNARVVASMDPQVPITNVITYNRLNERSRLCEVKVYERPGGATTTDFVENSQRYTIDFCYGTPEDAAYPEGVVIALLQGKQPPHTTDRLSPTGASYLTAGAISSLPPELADLKLPDHKPYRILAFATQGTLAQLPTSPGDGQVTQSGGGGKPGWWFGPERLEVQTSIILRSGQQREVNWRLVGVTSTQVSTDTRWRVEKVEVP
jgi:hypothetical protein